VRTDDSFFDPWGDFARAEPTPPAQTGSEPLPGAGAAPDEATDTGSLPRWSPPTDRAGLAPSRRAPRPPGRKAPEPARAPAGEPDPDGVDGHVDPAGSGILRAAVLPELHRLAEALRAERHETLIDDRTGLDEPCIRFQVRPRPGPFDELRRSLPVLELTSPDGGDLLVARTWLDPRDREPVAERTLPAESPERRVGRLLLDFVELVLARS
jgi:hypothetical protein